MDNLYWRDAEEPERPYQVPEDVVDLSFRLRGSRLQIDHAAVLAEALRRLLDPGICQRIGVHGVHMVSSGNGWHRPESQDAAIPLSRRARLTIRCRREDQADVAGISGETLQLGAEAWQVGECTIRKLSILGNLHARAVCCPPGQTEPEFLAQAADALQALDIDVARMICGRSGTVQSADGDLFTRALMVADLKPEESVRLQQQGLGEGRMLGCGLFVPHKGIDAVYTAQE